jgi:LAGLIDADG DNA endonuclease family
MSLWGNNIFALNIYFLVILIFFKFEECLVATNLNFFGFNHFLYDDFLKDETSTKIVCLASETNNKYFSKKFIISSSNEIHNIQRIRAESRIGPHNKQILSIIFGSLLGDGYAEYRSKGKGTRIRFYQEGIHLSYILWLHNYLANSGYCNPTVPNIQTRLGKKGVVRKIIRLNTWTYTSFNWIQELWYPNGKKEVPSTIGDFMDPLALAI